MMLSFLLSCSKNDDLSRVDTDYHYGRNLSHERIVLGDRLENPYKTENIARALNSLYPTKADRIQVEPTHLYVRFLPKDEKEYDYLSSLGINMLDHPLDYDILVEGDWYHDPEIPEDSMTWQYAVISSDFKIPDVRYEIIDKCYISSDQNATKSDGVDWEAVEREAYRLTGNEHMLAPLTKAHTKSPPEGRITIVDDDANGGKPLGVAGVKVSCNSFVKFDNAYTDRDGYYRMSKVYTSNIRYRLIFKNRKGFGIGFNLILLPASVSTLGKSSPSGVDMTVTRDSETKLFKRCAVNNAVYDYLSRCEREDLDICLPPSDLRIWIFNGLKSSCSVMMHNGAIVSMDILSSYLGDWSPLVELFLPDIILGTSGRDSYSQIYSTTCHELAHASHFSKVGVDYWNPYVCYILESFIASGGMMYGDGTVKNAGLCEVSEMWAYYIESKMYYDRYGGDFPSFGTSYWFYPQIFRVLDERGFDASEIFSVLDKDVTDRDILKSSLISEYPDRMNEIEMVFNRYSN